MARASSTTTKAGSDRFESKDRLADVIHDVMHSNWPAWSIDTLLTHPHQAIRMCQQVCARMGTRATEDACHRICRAALNNRKHGGLKKDRH